MNIKKINSIVINLFCFFIISNAYAQNKFSISTLSFLNDIKPFENAEGVYTLPQEIKDKYALYENKGILYVSGLAQIENNNAIDKLHQLKCITGSSINNIISLRVPLEALSQLNDVKELHYIELGRKVKPDLKDALIDTKADSVHAGILLPQAYSGKGVVVGITDWGFDYTHPTFYDTALSNLRIARAWDQYKSSGPAPASFSYGTEYASAQELLAAEHDTSNIYGLNTHGTHVAGIAAGAGAGTVFKGFAYESELVFVTILVDEASVLDAFTYIFNYAQSVSKPLVVNMSWGLYYIGTLDGSSLISQALNYMADAGAIFVSSAGNNGDVSFHIKKDFQPSDTLLSFVEFEPYSLIPTMWGQSLSLWGTPNASFQYGLEIYDNTYNLLETLPLYNTNDATMLDTMVLINNDTIIYKIECETANPHNQRPGVRLRVRNLKTNLYKIAIKVIADTGTVHIWNIIELVNDVGNWGAALTAPVSAATAGDNNYAIGEPACAEGVIAVASYRSQVTLPNGNTYYGNISYFSSKGPLISGVVKPDIAGPGHSVGSAISYFYNGSPISSVANVDFNGKNYKFGRMSGTSMSSPAVAGIAALLLEANPALSAPMQLNNLIKQTARTDTYTGNIPPEGDVLWGWGKINAYHAIRLATGMSGVNTTKEDISNIHIYPNPACNFVIIDNIEEGTYDISLYDITGKTVYKLQNVFMAQQYTLHLPLLKSGNYIIDVRSAEGKWLKNIAVY